METALHRDTAILLALTRLRIRGQQAYDFYGDPIEEIFLEIDARAIETRRYEPTQWVLEHTGQGDDCWLEPVSGYTGTLIEQLIGIVRHHTEPAE